MHAAVFVPFSTEVRESDVAERVQTGKKKKKTKGWILPSLLAAAYPIGVKPVIRVRTRGILGSHYRFQDLKECGLSKSVKVGEGLDA